MKKITVLFILLIITALILWFSTPQISPKIYKSLVIKPLPIPAIEVTPIKAFGPLPGKGPEDIALDSEGNLFTGLSNGIVLEINPNNNQQKIIARLPGRPLGLRLWEQTKLLVFVVGHGLYQIDLHSGAIQQLISKQFGFEEEIVPLNSSLIFLTDGSKYNILIPRQQVLAALEYDADGKIWIYNAVNNKLALLTNSLKFANGIELSPDHSFLIVSDMFNLRLLKYDFAAKNLMPFVDALPGYPDNIALGSDHLFWAALYSPPVKFLNIVLQYPLMRKIIAKLPVFILPRPKKTSWAIGVNSQGKIITAYKIKGLNITSVIENKGILYLGTLNKNYVYTIYSQHFRT